MPRASLRGPADRRPRLLYATEQGRAFFAELSANQATRIDASIAALPPDAAMHVRRFLVNMVDPRDRQTLDRLRLTDKV